MSHGGTVPGSNLAAGGYFFHRKKIIYKQHGTGLLIKFMRNVLISQMRLMILKSSVVIKNITKLMNHIKRNIVLSAEILQRLVIIFMTKT